MEIFDFFYFWQKKLESNTKIKFTKNELYTSAILLFVLALFVFLIKYKPNLWGIKHILNGYSDLLIGATKLISTKKNIYDFLNNVIIVNNEKVKIDFFFFSFYHIILTWAILAATPSPLSKRIICALSAFLLFTIYNTFRISIHITNTETIATYNWLFNILLIPRWLFVIGLLYFYWQKYPKLKEFLLEKFSFNDNFYKKSILKLLVLIATYYLVIIIFFNKYFYVNGSLLVDFILNSSKMIIKMMNIDVWLLNRLIYNDKAAIFMEDSCIGVNLMFIFASFIILMPGKRWHRFAFISVGIVLIILMNILRIVLIFVMLYRANNVYNFPIDWHDVFTYPVLLFTLLMWNLWLNKYSIPFSKQNNQKQTEQTQ